jgi:hypothetical protein
MRQSSTECENAVPHATKQHRMRHSITVCDKAVPHATKQYRVFEELILVQLNQLVNYLQKLRVVECR